MKRLALSALILLIPEILVAVAPAQTKSGDALAMEKAIWQGYQNKNSQFFKAVAYPDFRGIYPDKVTTIQQEMDGIKNCDVSSFDITDFNAVFIGSGLLMTHYTVTVNGTQTYKAGSVWKKQPGWKIIVRVSEKTHGAL